MAFTIKNFLQKLKSSEINSSEQTIKKLRWTETGSPVFSLRKEIAARYLRGEGIEIGALHAPTDVPSGVTVRYLDRMSTAQLKRTYPELSEYELAEVDIVDDGEILTSVLNGSVDFVIANHMVEHCQNPIFTLENWLRVLKPGGILYIGVPDKRYTFDKDRPVTALAHLIRDYTEGPEWSMNSHYEEWVRLVEKTSDDNIVRRAKALAELNHSIHFHVWTQVEFFEFLVYCRNNLSLPFDIELLQKNELEFIVILKKQN
ncbi:MAG TPA: methyltransferase type 11 [Cyanobacteria bacterium UBA8553]|nr:methyltransferase type 11 [Cyanobacteria bacterium UBA8553]HAJ64639.1 methyltransferase type 11 [Cyanobacteria bacterium UBA8543]